VGRNIGVEVTNNLKPAAHCYKAVRTAQAVLGQLSSAFHNRETYIYQALKIRRKKVPSKHTYGVQNQAWPWRLEKGNRSDLAGARGQGTTNGADPSA
jgi:hypothetical protein